MAHLSHCHQVCRSIHSNGCTFRCEGVVLWLAKPRFSTPLLAILTVFGVLGTASAVLAGPTTTDPNDTPLVDPNVGFSSPEGGNGLFDDSSGPMDLIHRAVLMNDMSLTEFRQQQQGRFGR